MEEPAISPRVQPSDLNSKENISLEKDERLKPSPESPATPEEQFELEGGLDVESHLEKEPSSIALCRKVLPVLEEEAACCSICLDEFTDEDPSANTACGHGYHLQCIMQWAQRSRECPLCFHTLALEDEDMNALLPFGEYVNPQQQQATVSMLETWEFERFLIQLASNEQRQRRAARRRGSHPTSEPRQILGHRGGDYSRTDPHEIATSLSVPRQGGIPDAQDVSEEFPASWPPASSNSNNDELPERMNTTSSSEAGTSHIEGLGSLGQALRSRWTALRFRESLNKTTQELKSLFGTSSTSSSTARHRQQGNA